MKTGHISKLLQNMEEFLSFREALSKETDRGCALMASSYLEFRLEQLLKKHFIDDSKSVENMLGPNGNLGTFSAKINISYFLGFISKNMKHDFDLVRKIRNEFAHTYAPLTFEDSKISDRCNKLNFHYYPEDSGPRSKFTGTVTVLLAVIDSQIISRKNTLQKNDTKEFEMVKKIQKDMLNPIRNIKNKNVEEIFKELAEYSRKIKEDNK